MRSRISRAALLVKVTARICPGKARRRGKDVGEARRQDAGLSSPRAGKHEHRPVDRLDRLALLVVRPRK